MMNRMKRVKILAFVLICIQALTLTPGGVFLAPQTLAQTDNPDGKSREELEKELAELERQIEEQRGQVETYQKQGKTLKNEISSLDSRIKKLNLQIQATEITIEKVGQNIVVTQKDINKTENRIDVHKDALRGALQQIYEQDRQGLMQILLANEQISDFFGDINEIARVQDNLRIALEEVVNLRQELVTQKNELEFEKEDNENLKAAQQGQKQGVQTTQKEKASLLQVTKGKESEYQKLLKESQETAAQIRKRIFQLLGGGELTFEKA